MLRFILKIKTKEKESGHKEEHYLTIDGDITKLETFLRKSRYGYWGYEIYELVGVEIIYKDTEGNNV